MLRKMQLDGRFDLRIEPPLQPSLDEIAIQTAERVDRDAGHQGEDVRDSSWSQLSTAPCIYTPTYRYNSIYRNVSWSEPNHICISRNTDLKFAPSRYSVLISSRAHTRMTLNLDEINKSPGAPGDEILHWLKDPDVDFPDQTHSNEHGVCAGRSINVAACRSPRCPRTWRPCNAPA